MKRRKEGFVCLLFILFVVAVCAVCLGYAYLVATSDLPGWLKYWLLK